MAQDIPADSQVVLADYWASDASKQFLDTLLGQGWDTWEQGLSGDGAVVTPSAVLS